MDGGMSTLWADGVEKVLAGVTSLEELARVTTI
jgi:type II secretory ATPase GspE/PulE/Tfp pilus assembly ATPase PilB-like protein